MNTMPAVTDHKLAAKLAEHVHQARGAYAEAVEALVDDFAEGKLANGDRSPQDKLEVGLGREK